MYTSKGNTIYRHGIECAHLRTYNMGYEEGHGFTTDVAEALNTAPRFTSREISTMLAALRYWQLLRTGCSPGDDFEDISTNCGKFAALDEHEVDLLCEKINIAVPDDEAEGETLDTHDIEAAAEVFDAGISQQGLLQTLTEEPAVIVLDGAAELTPEYVEMVNATNAALAGPTMFDLFAQLVKKARDDHKLLLLPDEEGLVESERITAAQEERIAAYIASKFLQLFFATKNSLPITMDSEAHRLREDLQAMFRIVATQAKLTE